MKFKILSNNGYGKNLKTTSGGGLLPNGRSRVIGALSGLAQILATKGP